MANREVPEGYVGWMKVGDGWLRFPDAKEGENGKKEEKEEEKSMENEMKKSGFEYMSRMMMAFETLERAIAEVDDISNEVTTYLKSLDPDFEYPDIPKLRHYCRVIEQAKPAYILLASLADISEPKKDGDSE